MGDHNKKTNYNMVGHKPILKQLTPTFTHLILHKSTYVSQNRDSIVHAPNKSIHGRLRPQNLLTSQPSIVTMSCIH